MDPLSLWRALVDLVLPDSCPGCGRPAPAPACAECLAPLGRSPRPAPPDPLPDGLPVPWAVATYDDPVRALIIGAKEHQRLSLAAPLGTALAAAVAASTPPSGPPLLLVPIPSSRAAVRTRGHDPVLRMATRAARILCAQRRPTTVARVLGHSRGVADQAGLSHRQRHANVTGALRVLHKPPVSARLIVVDDIVTTGATLAEAVRALRAAGCPVTSTAVVAATGRRRDVRPRREARSVASGRPTRALPTIRSEG